MNYDVIVIGAGTAGLTAAVRAAQDGARVLVLAKGIGSTHLAPGTIDVLGYRDGRRVERPADELAGLVADHPEHPYAHVGRDGVAEALDWLAARFPEGGLAPYGYAGGTEENLLLPTAVGAARPSAFVPGTMAPGDLRAGGPVCLVTIRALKDFYPSLAAAGLTAAGHEARAIALDVPIEGRLDVNALGLADAFDAPAFRSAVVGALVGRLRPGERVGFPAALGLNAPHAAWTDLQERLGRPVFEIPTLPPSVPGIRLFRTLREALRRAGGRIVVGAPVAGVEADAGRVHAVRARVAGREQRHGADWVVLATGGFASGGIELDARWTARETVLGLPVAGVPEPGGTRFVESYFAHQPIARAGIATDAALRPLDARGERVYENVLVAGASLAGAEPWKEKSGDGISVATGYRAAGLIRDGGTRSGTDAAAMTEA